MLSQRGNHGSELPPLRPNSQVHQQTNSAPARNAVVETQRMKTSVIGQIQAVQNEQERQIQQMEAQISLVARELTPKMQNVDRHNGFIQQQLDDLLERISQIESTGIPKILGSNDEVQLKFDQSIRTKTQSKLKPLADEIKQEQQRGDHLGDVILEGLTQTTDSIRDLMKGHQDCAKELLDFGNKMKTKFEEIQPRIGSVEAKLGAFESAVETALQNIKSSEGMQGTARKLRKDLDELEADGIPQTVQNAASETLASVSATLGEIDQKFTTARLSLTQITNTVQVTNEQQRNADQQVEDLAKTSFDTKSKMDDQNRELDERLSEIEKVLQELANSVNTSLDEISEENSGDTKWTVQGLEDDIESLRNMSKDILMTLKDDWTKFNADNEKVQKNVDDEVAGLSDSLSGQANIMKRIQAAEKRAKWCVDRMNAWQKEEEKRKKLQVEEDLLWDKLQDLEQKLYEAEARIKQQDSQDAPAKFEVPSAIKDDHTDAPAAAATGDKPIVLKIADDMKLTYESDDKEITFPEPVVRTRPPKAAKPKAEEDAKPAAAPAPETKPQPQTNPEPEEDEEEEQPKPAKKRSSKKEAKKPVKNEEEEEDKKDAVETKESGNVEE